MFLVFTGISVLPESWQVVEPRTPLAWAASALPLSYNSRTTTSPHTILYMYCTDGTECFSRTPGSHSVCEWLPLFSPHNIYFQHEARCFQHNCKCCSLPTTPTWTFVIGLYSSACIHKKNTHWQELDSYIKNYSTDVGYAPSRCLIAFSYTEKERATLVALWTAIL